MGNYNTSPFKAALPLMYPGIPVYLRGSWSQDQSPTQMYVTSVAITANVATLGVTVYGGNIPAVGSKISVQGTQSNGGEFNVTNAVLTAVNIASTGSGTVSFALAAATVATTTDAGVAIVPQPEAPETVSNATSIAVAAPKNSWGGDLDRTVTAVCSFPTIPTTCSVQLQGAMFDEDSQYVNLGVIATVAGSAVSANGLTVVATWLYYRAVTSGVTGAGTYTCKIAD